MISLIFLRYFKIKIHALVWSTDILNTIYHYQLPTSDLSDNSDLKFRRVSVKYTNNFVKKSNLCLKCYFLSFQTAVQFDLPYVHL